MATAIAPELEHKGRAARAAAPALARTSTAVKDRALLNVAEALEAQTDRIVEANGRDLEAGVAGGLSSALMDRLLLDAQAHRRRRGTACGTIAALPGPRGAGDRELHPPRRPRRRQASRASGRRRRHLREPPQRHRRHRRPLFQGGRPLHPARRQGGRSHQHGAGRHHPRRHRGGGRSPPRRCSSSRTRTGRLCCRCSGCAST